ncbi:hypothetical protein BGZ57DRAFT_91941 [Hyaloscypha finlandica]|nr:hypothetical protein BGZ57DRAFT_91941 [Hyaloscypha finlandica]
MALLNYDRAFISSAHDCWWLKCGEPKPSQQGQSFMTTKTFPENSERALLSMSSELTNSTESNFSVLEDKNYSSLLNIDGDCESMPRGVELSDCIWPDRTQNQNIQDVFQESGLYESSFAPLFPQDELWPSQGPVQAQLLDDGHYHLVEDLPQDPNDTVAMKRARNTLAARKSRQRKMMQFDELEERIAKLEAERDHWRTVAINRQQVDLGNTLRRDNVDLASTAGTGDVNMDVQEIFGEIDAFSTDDKMPV